MSIFKWVDKLLGSGRGTIGTGIGDDPPPMVASYQQPFSGIEFTYVVSSNVQAIRYDPDYQKLQIAFLPKGKRGTSIYEYDRVPQSVYDDFVDYASKGKFVWAAIRGVWDTNYPYRRIK